MATKSNSAKKKVLCNFSRLIIVIKMFDLADLNFITLTNEQALK
jgi:hypothetical protein